MKKLFDGYLICTDFDGTFAVNSVVSEENANAVKYFQENGGLFTVASGRSCLFVKKYTDIFRPNAPVIGTNGAGIRHHETDEILDVTHLPEDILSVVKQMVDKYPSIGRVMPFYDDGPRSYTVADGAYLEYLKTPYAPHQKLVLIVNEDESDEMLAFARGITEGRYNVERAAKKYIEFQLYNCSKGTAVLKVKEMTGARVLVCAGNFENDESMVRAADIGYAVGDSVESLILAADRITVPHKEHSIAAIIRDLEKDIKGNIAEK